jgi:proteasome accessory factor B
LEGIETHQRERLFRIRRFCMADMGKKEKDEELSASHKARIERLNRLLKLLPAPGTSADQCPDGKRLLKTLADAYKEAKNDKSRRRILQYDLKTLMDDECIEEANPGGRPLRYRRIKKQWLDQDTRVWNRALRQIRDLIADTVPRRELNRLWERLLNDPDVVKLDVCRLRVIPDTLRLQPVALEESVLIEVITALAKGYALDVRYRNAKDESKDARIHPQALIQRGPIPYLFALKNDEDEPVRLYALQRMIRAQALPETAARQVKDFDLDEAIKTGPADFGSGESIDLELLVRGYLARILPDCPLAPNQRLEDEPIGAAFEIRVWASVPSTGQLLRWLLGAGDNVEVVAPPELRQTLASQAAKMAGIYGVQPSSDSEHDPQ